MKRTLALVLAVVMVAAMLPLSVFAADKPTVTVVNYRTQQGEDVENFRCSSLLEVKTSGFKAGATLQYTYTTTLNVNDDELSVYDIPDMYTATDSNSHEQYQTYREGDTFSGWKYFTLCGRDGNRAVTDTQLRGKTVTVTVTDGTNTVKWTNQKDFIKPNLAADMADLSYGMFTGDDIELKHLLGLSGVTHITCSNCNMSGSAPLNTNVATISDDTLYGVRKGETSFTVSVRKSSSCIMHSGQNASEKVNVRVFQVPTATADNTTITLTNLEEGLSYTINGVTKVAKAGDTALVFDGLLPNTTYPVMAAAAYKGQSVTNSSSAKTTNRSYLHLMLDDKPVSAETLYGKGAKIYDRASSGISFLRSYYESTVVDKDNGVYSPQNEGINSDREYYYRIGNGDYVKLNVGVVQRNDGKDYYEKYYTLSYQLPGGVTGITVPATETVFAGNSVTLKGLTDTPQYAFKCWKDQSGKTYNAGAVISDITAKIELTAVFKERYDISFAAYGLDSDNDNVPDTGTLVKPEGAVITLNTAGGKYNGTTTPAAITLKEDTKILDPVKEKSVFMGWKATEGANYAVTLTAQYLPDENENKVPDPFEILVTFKVENGTWADKTTADITKTYVLCDGNGKWSETGSAAIPQTDIPVGMLPDVAHAPEDGAWNVGTIPASVTKNSVVAFTFKFDSLKTFNVIYPQYGKDDNNDNVPDAATSTYDYGTKVIVNPNGGKYDGETEFELTESLTLNTPTKDKAIFLGWEETVNGNTVTYKAMWADDLNENGIPDSVEVTVTFTTKNGTWADKTTADIEKIYALCDQNGKWDETGTAAIPQTDIPIGMLPDVAHTDYGAWNVGTIPTSVAKNDQTAFIYSFDTLKTFDVTYPKYGKDDNNDDIPDTVASTHDYGTKVIVDPNGGQYDGETEFELTGDLTLNTPTKEKAVFMGWEETENGNTVTYKAMWEDDLNENGVPDQYDITVTFKIENGTWADHTDADIVKEYVLYDEIGKWSETGDAVILSGDIPVGMLPDAAHTDVGAWNITIPETVSKNSVTTFTYQYNILKSFDITYPQYGKDDDEDGVPDDTAASHDYGTKVVVNPNGGQYDGETEFTLTGPVTLGIPTKENAIFAGWAEAPGDGVVIFTAIYFDDKVGGTDGDGKDTSDGIPDQFQAKVEYNTDGGTWEDGTTESKHIYVTLLDDNGKWSETGKATVTAPEGSKIKGKMFTGWQDAAENVYGAGETIVVTADTTLTATYQEITDCPRDRTCPIEPFIDTKNDYWWHDGIHFCTEKKYMVGVSKTEFAPNKNTTRGMIVAILWRIEGSPKVKGNMTFTDVKHIYYYEAIKWAQATGVVTGYSDTEFGAEDCITREQMAAILYRYAKYCKVDVKNPNTLNQYKDKNTVSKWALDAMKWANYTNLIKGYTETKLMPKELTTRAQVAEMIWRYCNFVRVVG